MVDDRDDVAADLDNNVTNTGSVDYSPDEVEPEDVDEPYVKDRNSVSPMAVYQPWDSAFEETDFHLQNPEDESEVDTYSGHAGIAHIWMEYGDQDEVVLVYEFDSTFSFAEYPSMSEAEAVDQDIELLGRQALSEGEAAITKVTSKEDVESLVGELSDLDESLLEEGYAEHNANILTAMENGDTESHSVDVVDTQFDSHQELYREKDRVEN